MSSGVAVDSQVMKDFDEMKLRKTHAFLVMKISDDGTTIVVETAFPAAEAARLGTEATYEAFVASLPKDEARYGVVDLAYENGMEGVRSRLTFISWNPMSGKIRPRMMYAASKNGLRQRLDGVYAEVQCTDGEELAFESVFAAVAPKGAVPLVRPPIEAEE